MTDSSDATRDNNEIGLDVSEEYREFYKKYIYNLLPYVYREHDSNGSLRDFLEIIGNQAAAIRQDIENLWKNFSIDRCDEWVAPYLGDLISAKAAYNSIINARSEVKSTIFLRKRKGTIPGLVTLARNIADSNASVREIFSECGTTYDVGERRPGRRKPELVDTRNSTLSQNIRSRNENIPHTIDVRRPTNENGWYNTKNILMQLAALRTYRITNAEVASQKAGFRYYFRNFARKNVAFNVNPLYDIENGKRIDAAKFATDPFYYFSSKKGMGVKIGNVLAACSEKPVYSSISPPEEPLRNLIQIAGKHTTDDANDEGRISNVSFIGIHEHEGIRILEPRKFPDSQGKFIIKLYHYAIQKGVTELASFDFANHNKPYKTKASNLDNLEPGVLLIGIGLSGTTISAQFPETIMAIRDSRRPRVDATKEKEDSLISKYQNAIYVYLPSFEVSRYEGSNKKSIDIGGESGKDVTFFFIDDDGSTYEVEEVDGELRLGRLARRSCGNVYPPRMLTYSYQPLSDFTELNRSIGIRANDRLLNSGKFAIEAIGFNKSAHTAWKVGRLDINEASASYTNESEIWLRWIIFSEEGQQQSWSSSSSSFSFITHFKLQRADIVDNLDSTLSFTAIDQESSEGREKFLEDLIRTRILSKVGLYSKPSLAKTLPKVEKLKVPLPRHSAETNNTFEFDVKLGVPSDSKELLSHIVAAIKSAIGEDSLFSNEGDLVLRITSSDKGDRFFPLSEITLTNNSSKSVIVYLPQISFKNGISECYLYVGSDGSTFYKFDPLDDYARKSAGQVVSISGKYPMQQRIPVYLNLMPSSDKVSTAETLSGELAIDPEHGIFSFSVEDGVVSEVTADWNYAFSADIGAGTYDRRKYLKKPTRWVSKFGHVKYDNALPSLTFRTLADALYSAEEGDVIQIEDSAIFEMNKDVHLGPNIRDNLILQAANQIMPTLDLRDDDNESGFSLVSDAQIRSLIIDGVFIAGTPMKFCADFSDLILNCCTADPGVEGERRTSIEIESASNPDVSNVDIRRKKNVSITKSIMGSLRIDDSVTHLRLEDSIVENFDGSAIVVEKGKKDETRMGTALFLEASRSNILSSASTGESLNLGGLCCSDVIFTGRVKVEPAKIHEDSDNICVRYSRLEIGSFIPIQLNQNYVGFKCTFDRPIFISSTFGNPGYLHLHPLTSQSILAGGEDNLEMGVYNRLFKPQRLSKLRLSLSDYLPFGIECGILYEY